MALESETSRPIAVSTSCLCSDGSQMSTLDTRGPCRTVSLDQSQHSKAAKLHTHPHTQSTAEALAAPSLEQ